MSSLPSAAPSGQPPTPYYIDPTVTIHHGDCLDVLRMLPDASVDSVVCDPPYGLEFMGKEWDGANGFRRSLNPADVERDNPFGRTSRTSPEYRAGQTFGLWCLAWAEECLRVLKPGGHMLAFGGTRTWHRLACAVEDAGFEIRDSIAWMYATGFPKSLDVSKAIDKAAGATREVLRPRLYEMTDGGGYSGNLNTSKPRSESAEITAPATPDAERWQGWGTALKPAFEPVVVARKPLAGTVAANVLAHGTGALNVDGCRTATGDKLGGGASTKGSASHAEGWDRPWKNDPEAVAAHAERVAANVVKAEALGRWPANVILDESQSAALDQMSGVQRDGVAVNRNRSEDEQRSWYGTRKSQTGDDQGYGGTGGASRFMYVAKADTSERPYYFRPTCECEDAWPSRPSPNPSPTASTSLERDTSEIATPTASSTSKSGSYTTEDPSPTGTTSTTSTATSGTTPSTISSPSPSLTTSAPTLAASSATANGGSPAASVASSSPSPLSTGTSPVKGGPPMAAVARATSPAWSATSVCGRCGAGTRREAHATVKPLALMRWLVRLVTPPGGTVLEPFAGSGTTVEACILEGFRCVAIEREADYLPLIKQRIHRRRDPVEAVKAAGEDGGLFDLLDGGAA